MEQFAKEVLNIEQILSMAGKKKSITEIQNIFKIEIKEPTDDLVRFFAKKMTDKPLTQSFIEDYRQLCKLAFADIIHDLVSDKINSLQAGFKADAEIIDNEPMNQPEIVTTEEELDGYYVVKSILCEIIPLQDITHKDTASYFNILLKAIAGNGFADFISIQNKNTLLFRLMTKKKKKFKLQRLKIFFSTENAYK